MDRHRSFAAAAAAVVAAVVVGALTSSPPARADEATPDDCSGDQSECSFADGAATKCGTCECELESCDGPALCSALTADGCRQSSACTPVVDEAACRCTKDVEVCGGCACRSTRASSGFFAIAGVAVAVAAGIVIGRRRRPRS